MNVGSSKLDVQGAPPQQLDQREPVQFELGDGIATLVRTVVDERFAGQAARESETIKLLELSQQSLKDSNDALRTKLEKEWDKPQKVLAGISVFAVLLFGSNWFQQYAATQDFRSQTDALRDQKLAVEAKFALFNTFESEYRAQVERDQTRRASSLRILALLDVARDQLMHRRNYDRALHYANEAQQELQSLREQQDRKNSEDDYRISGALARMCSQLEGAISLIQAECYFQRGKPHDLTLLRAAATRVINSGCGCLEGHYFLGLYHLLESEQLRGPEAEVPERSAVAEFQKAIGQEGQSTLASVFLAAVQLELGNNDAAIANAANFLEEFPESADGRQRLSPDTQARIWAASMVKELASFVRSPRRIRDASGCTVDVGAIGTAEAALLERLFLRLAKRKNLLFKDRRQSDQFGFACLHAAVLLRNVSCGIGSGCPNGNCLGSDNVVPPQLLVEYSVVPRVDLPPLSRDIQLGLRRDSGETVMIAIEPVLVERAVIVIDDDDNESVLTHTVEVGKQVETVVKPGAEPPPAHYIRYSRVEAAPAPAD